MQHIKSVFGCDPADRNQGLLEEGTASPHLFDADDGIGILLRGGAEDGTQGHVIDRLARRGTQLPDGDGVGSMTLDQNLYLAAIRLHAARGRCDGRLVHHAPQ